MTVLRLEAEMTLEEELEWLEYFRMEAEAQKRARDEAKARGSLRWR
jgi:hypothetical protein